MSVNHKLHEAGIISYQTNVINSDGRKLELSLVKRI